MQVFFDRYHKMAVLSKDAVDDGVSFVCGVATEETASTFFD
jgi:hypothetical protein